MILVVYFSSSLHCSDNAIHSFGLYMILDLSIASGLFSIYFGTLFLALNSKVDQVNRMILIRFDVVDSIIAFWLVGLHAGNA
jgi:hypothetical protein